MRNKDSLTLLRLKMLGGYVSLLIVFIIASCIIVTKSGALEENGHRYKENVERRTLSENAFLQMIYLDSVPMADFAEQTLTYVRMLDGTTCPAITVDKYPGQQVTITAPHGAGVAQIRVQPEAGAANTYEITFTQGAPASVRLDGINVNAVPLATFAPTTLQYALNYSGSLPVVEGVTSDSTLNVDVLWKGETASIQVTDQAGNRAVYTIVFTRQTSSNKALKAILVNGSPLDKFTPAVLTYDSVLAAGSAYPEVTYIADEDAQVVFFGQLADGKWGISVVAEDGTISTYTVQFTIAKYTNATLKNLTVEGKVIPFSPAVPSMQKVVIVSFMAWQLTAAFRAAATAR